MTTFEEIREVYPETVKYLDYGFVSLVDVMGNDKSIADSARISYGQNKKNKTVDEDRNLIRYLMRNRHTSPFEMCLRGDTYVNHYSEGKTKIKQIAEIFNKEDFASLPVIKSVNENGEIVEAKIKHCYKTGVKPIYRVTIDGFFKKFIDVTNNHPFKTPNGYKTLLELKAGDDILMAGVFETVFELWMSGIPARKIAKHVSISVNDVYNIKHLLKLPKREYKRSCNQNSVCIIDNNYIDQNRPKKPSNGCVDKTYIRKILSIEYLCEEEVYDLEVDNEYHNFVANQFVVHNCEFKFFLKMPIFVMRQHIRHRMCSINEYSGRYSVMSDEFYHPEMKRLQKQSSDNKQMSDGQIDSDVANQLDAILQESYNNSYNNYKECLENGLSREIARIQLPLANYTECFWKIDAHNFLHYVKLRDDPAHAQNEIVQLAQIMYRLVKKYIPITCQAFEDYQKNAITFSALEIQMFKSLLKDDVHLNEYFDSNSFSTNLSKREIEEFKQKINLIRN